MTIPLPEPFHGFYGVPMYTADQMRAYGDAVRAEERERCAAILLANAEACTGLTREILLANVEAIRTFELTGQTRPHRSKPNGHRAWGRDWSG